MTRARARGGILAISAHHEICTTACAGGGAVHCTASSEGTRHVRRYISVVQADRPFALAWDDPSESVSTT